MEQSAKILNIKGSGGIGKTAVAKKVAVELAKRNHFNEGIHFIACEHITDAGTFEAKTAQCFDMDNVIDLKEHLKNYRRFDSLIILDNFESLLTFKNEDDIKKVKDLVSFVCDYASIVITSRQTIDYEFEDIYELYALTTDEALELFYTNYGKLGKDEEKILRRDILENLLNNNPLVIKIITRNLPRHKNIISLKEELEENFFAKTSEDVEKIFDQDADVNIEKTRSLFHSINYSYQKLDNREKLTFELLYLFPDGIHLENFKNCFAKGSDRKSVNKISDFQIKSLENKSLVENDSGFIRLQSMLGRFAKYQFKKRTPEEKSKYFKDAFSYNYFYLGITEAIHDKKSETLALSMFDSISNNIIDMLDYLDQFEEDSKVILEYIILANRLSRGLNQSMKLVKKIRNLKKFLNLDKEELLLLKVIAINLVFYSIEFSKSFQHLNNILALEKLLKLDTNKHVKNRIFGIAGNIYEYEGYSYQIFKHLVESNSIILSFFQPTLFRLGIYNDISKLVDYKKDFFHYETQLNANQLNPSDLKEYISLLFPKDHLNKLQTHYTLAKIEGVEKGTIKKLIVTNPYTKGLKNLMYTFVEEDPKKKINYFEAGIQNLEHIKYYYIEGIYFYAKYLKEIDHDEYQKWFGQGFDMADRYHYRFLKHQFLNLKTGSNEVYDETKYPLPDDLDVEAYIEKYNKYWSDKKKGRSKK